MNKELITENNFRIDVKDFNFYYGDNHALKNINLAVEDKSIVALIGPSGCGKSTFLRSINRMNDLIENVTYEGIINIDGQNILSKNTDVYDLRTKVGMVFQKPNPFPKSIYDNVVYAPRLHGEKDKDKLDQIVEESLKSVALWNEVKDKLKTSSLGLSGGQQQRLCIARAIATQPEILLMDEPTSALDPISTAKIEDLMESLKENFTIVIVTHSMQQAARISDQTAFFLSGELIESDDTTKIFSNPQNQKTEDYITGRFG